jgi:hypothetical protein
LPADRTPTLVTRIKPDTTQGRSPTQVTARPTPSKTRATRIAAAPKTTHSLRTLPPAPAKQRTQRRLPTPVPISKARVSSQKASVRLSTSIGISPLLVSFTVEMPKALKKGADFLWTDNGIPICNDIQGQKILMEPGRHRIGVLVITQDNQELRASSDVTVFERLTKKPIAKSD